MHSANLHGTGSSCEPDQLSPRLGLAPSARTATPEGASNARRTACTLSVAGDRELSRIGEANWPRTPGGIMALDRITVSVIQHRLESIVQEMGEAMLRTAYSQILNSSRDFSTAVFDGQGRLAAQAEHVPIHVGALPWAVAAITADFAGRIRPGDMYLLNDPYHGGNHLPDLTVLLPVFVGERLAFWSINRAHQSDIGGATHGAYNPGATEIWQEGLRIPPIRLSEAGRPREDLLDMLALNVRNSR